MEKSGDMDMAHRLGFFSFPEETEMPKWLSQNESWAWDLGYRLARHLKLYGARVVLLLIFSLALRAQPATTNVADTFYTGVGPSFCTGSFTLTWTDFYSKDGFLIKGGTSQPILVNSMGQFSVNVVPTNTNTTPPFGIYTVRYSLQPSNCAPGTEYWNVPSSMTPVNLNQVRTLPSPPPSLIPPASIAPPTSGPSTQALCWTLNIVQWSTACGGSGGGVSSVGLSLPGIFTVTGSPVTSSGTLTGTLASQLQNLVFASPNGSSGPPLFRALAMADLPNTVGTVKSFSAGNLSPLFTTSVAASTTAPALSFTQVTQNANLVYAGPTSGGAANPTFRPLVGSDLPNPSATTLGGILSIVAASHKWINAISTAGVPNQTQPACGDLSDSAAGCSATSLPPSGTAGGDLTGTYPNPGVGQVNGAAVPLTSPLLASNGSRQLTNATAHGPSTVKTCSSSSGSGTTYTCSTSPSFAPAAGDEILWQPDVQNTGSATLNVNSAGAKTIKKQSGAANLAAADICASPAQYLATYDGTNWEIQGQLCSSSSLSITQPYLSTGGNFYGPIYQLSKAVASFTGDNCSAVTFDTTYGYPYLSVASFTNLCVEYQTAPSTPYTIKALIGHDMSGAQPGASGNGAMGGIGIAFRDGTGKVIAFYMFQQSASLIQILLEKWTTTTSFSGTYQSYAPGTGIGLNDFLYRNPTWWSMEDDGTNLTWFWSIDGNHWKQFYQKSRTDFFGSGPTQVGIVTRSASANPLEAWVPSWNN